ncbi:MAG: class I SAM-dependent methyltransferase [Actinomycetia bacterium]|nr:class I SAM-dependent methyltransferase [Actinomycetes bacterium]
MTNVESNTEQNTEPNVGLTMYNLLIESHSWLTRQGPGSPAATVKALSFLGELSRYTRVADLGCGTGGQTMLLARQLPATIVALDQSPEFIHILNTTVEQANLQPRVTGVVGQMEALPFQPSEFDLIWSEGAIDAIGLKTGLLHWRDFLKVGGYVAFTCPSWFSAEHPPEVDSFWLEAGSALSSIGDNIATLQSCGFNFIAAFALPEECWTENYFIPRTEAEQKLLQKYSDIPLVMEFLESSRYEIELYERFGQSYGYAFYIGYKV